MNKNWRLLRLSAENIFRYKSLDISFSKEIDTYLIVGKNHDDEGTDSNGSGKSSIPDIFAWCGFGKTARTEKFDRIRTRGLPEEEITRATWTLTNGEDEITVSRQKSQTTGVKLSFYSTKLKGIGGDLTLRTPTLTQQAINRFFGLDAKKGFQDFLSSVYFSTTASKGFLSDDVGPIDRQRVLERFLNLSVLDKAMELATTEGRAFGKELEYKEGEINGLRSSISDIDIKSINKSLKSDEIERIFYKKQHKIKSDIIEKRQSFINDIAVRKSIIEEIEQKQESYKKTKLQLLAEYEAAKQQDLGASKIKSEWAKCKDEFAELDEPLKIATEDVEVTEDEMRRLQGEYDSKSRSLMGINSEIDRLLTLIVGAAKCPECKTKLDTTSIPIEKLNVSLLDDQVKEAIVVKNGLVDRTTELEGLIEKAKKDLSKKSQILGPRLKRFTFLNTLMRKANSVDTSKLDSVIEQAKYLQKVMRENDQNIITEKVILERAEKDLSEAGFDDGDYDSELKEVQSLINKYNERIPTYKAKIELYNITTNKIDTFSDDLENLRKCKIEALYWVEAFKEIKRHLLTGFIPVFEDRVNSLLKQLNVIERVDFKLTYDTKSGNTRAGFNIKVFDGKHWDDLEGFSGGEKSRIFVSIGFALRDISTRQVGGTFGLLFCDELVDTLDETGIRYFFGLLDSIEGQKFIISHKETLGDICDQTIQVTRKNNISIAEIL